MLLATHSIGKELRVYRVRIDFQHASCTVQHLKVLPNFGLSRTLTDSTGTSSENSMNNAHLNFLDFVPAGPDSSSKDRAPPQVFAAFSSAMHDFQGNDIAVTFLCGWQMYKSRAALHSSLAQLSPKERGTVLPKKVGVSLKFPGSLFMFLPKN